MKVLRTIVIEREIECCFNECPYFDVDADGMICRHPNARYDGRIIYHPACDDGFPNDCPLVILENLENHEENRTKKKD